MLKLSFVLRMIPQPNINNSNKFHKNSVNETQNVNKNAMPRFPRWLPRGQKGRIMVQTFNRNISETIWDRTLKFGTFTYLKSMYIGSKFYWNLKRWVSSMSHFDVEFPNCTRFHLFLNHHCYLQNIFLHKNFSHSKIREECIMSYIYFNFWKCSWIAFTCSKQWKH